MRRDRFDIFDFSNNEGPGRGKMDLRPDLPFSTDKITGVDLTHVIHTSEVAASGGGHGSAKPGTGGGTSFSPYTSGAADGQAGYDITIEFTGTAWTQALHDAFVTAADRLTSLIIGDLPNVSVRAKGGIKTVDDITITAELGNIDGLYGVLGQAGPTSVRTGSSLPATAQMKFDIVDVNDMGLSVFSQVILHEMSHSLGIGSIWDRLGLVSNGEFIGAGAVSEYHRLGGTHAGVPVEQDGGSGTAGSHWDEETFHNELMTGYINDGNNPFSAMSAASFGDLGYQIRSDYQGWADAYFLA